MTTDLDLPLGATGDLPAVEQTNEFDLPLAVDWQAPGPPPPEPPAPKRKVRKTKKRKVKKPKAKVPKAPKPKVNGYKHKTHIRGRLLERADGTLTSASMCGYCHEDFWTGTLIKESPEGVTCTKCLERWEKQQTRLAAGLPAKSNEERFYPRHSPRSK